MAIEGGTPEAAISAEVQLAGDPGPTWVAIGRAEPLVATVLCAVLVALLALDLQAPGWSNGNPTAIVIPVALLAGWTLRTHWAVPVWALCAAASVAAAATGSLRPLNAAVIALGAIAAGTAGHAGSASYRESLGVLDRQVDLIRRVSGLVAGPTNLAGALEVVLQATADVLGHQASGGEVDAAVLFFEDGEARLLSALGINPVDDATLLVEARTSGRSPITTASGRAGFARVDAEGAPWGVLVVRLPYGHRFGRRELTRLRAVADLAGAAVESRRRAGDLDQLRRRLQVSLDLAVEIGASLDPAEVAMVILSRAGEALDTDRVTLTRVHGEEAEVVAVHDRGRAEPATWTGDRFPTEMLHAQPIVREAMERRLPVAGGELPPETPRERSRDEAREVRAVLAIPLIGDGELVGLLTLTRRSSVPFSAEDVATVSQFASVAVLALMNSWAHAEMERSQRSLDETARQLHMAVEAAADVGFETELDQVTLRLLARSAQMVHADRGSIGRFDGDQLIVEANWPTTEQQPGAARMMSLAGVPGLLETLRSGRHLQHSADGVGGAPARHNLQYPLMAGGELVGVMALSRTAAGPFDEAHLLGLQQLTSLTALTLRSARLLTRARSLGLAKSEFLNMAAHELRTPLAVVRGYLSMMADGTLEVPESTRGTVVTLLCQKTDELSVMVDQILTAAQLQAGHVQLRREVFDLREAIGKVLEQQRVRAQQAGAELWWQPLPEPVRVEAVQTSVARILDNLVANAITYGNGLPVRLTVEVDDPVLVRVEDQGIGMSQQQQARLFEPFFRVDQPAVGGQAGAGLGLAVSRRLAEFSGGSLDLEWTQLGAGSTFVLRLPAAVETVMH